MSQQISNDIDTRLPFRRRVRADWSRDQWIAHSDALKLERALMVANGRVGEAYRRADAAGHRASRVCPALTRARRLAADRDILARRLADLLAVL